MSLRDIACMHEAEGVEGGRTDCTELLWPQRGARWVVLELQGRQHVRALPQPPSLRHRGREAAISTRVPTQERPHLQQGQLLQNPGDP